MRHLEVCLSPFKRKNRISIFLHAEPEKRVSISSFFMASEFQVQRNINIGKVPSRNDSPPGRRPQHVVPYYNNIEGDLNQRVIFFCGFEKDRNTLKYLCPAAVYDFSCKGCGECSSAGQVNPGEYGRIVRIKIIEEDRRIFTPIPYGTRGWGRAYNRRSYLERINSWLDNDFDFEKHYMRGKAKMQTRVGLATAVMMVMTLGHVRAGRIERMRSLVQPIARAA